MRVLIVGAGATGGFFGLRLARAGRDVTFLVRPGRAAALRERGLRITGVGGDDRIEPRLVTAAELHSSYDLVVLAVKATALDQSMDDIAPAVSSYTSILPILNGMAHIDLLNARFGKDAVLGGVAYLATSVDDQGDIHVLTPDERLLIGDQGAGANFRAERALETLHGAGFEVGVADDILAEMWSKWVFIAGAGVISCLMRGAVGDIAAVPGGVELERAAVAEAAAVAAAAAYPVPEEQLAGYTATLTKPGSPYAPSFYRDMRAGRPIEAEHVFGDLATRAAALAVDTPLLDLALMNMRVYQHRWANARG
ncbi:2-dehydropantoate 2-reductase [Streptomyces sp. NBC_01190]|uniref:2-dehydropantoate 2-reductase n=1 Tax=Streptomyces sp. NBC_01190 TaxID=2903767 RepID=UPI003863F158|nr:2-dehydropantoate 2-reductase [Streptomyces sp. NBC_01190]